MRGICLAPRGNARAERLPGAACQAIVKEATARAAIGMSMGVIPAIESLAGARPDSCG